MPSCAAKGMPTVVPGPKKSPSAPAGTANWLRLVIGTLHAGVGQRAVAFAMLFTGAGSAEISGMKLAPGLLRLNRLKNSANGITDQRSPNEIGRLTRKSICTYGEPRNSSSDVFTP